MANIIAVKFPDDKLCEYWASRIAVTASINTVTKPADELILRQLQRRCLVSLVSSIIWYKIHIDDTILDLISSTLDK